MKNTRTYILLIILFIGSDIGFAQQTPVQIDELITLLSYEKEKYCAQLNALDLSEYDDDVLRSKIQFLQSICLPDSIIVDHVASLETNISTNSDSRVQGFLQFAKGIAKGVMDEYDAAVQHYTNALNFLDRKEDAYLYAYSHIAVGYGYYTLHSHDLAIQYFEMANKLGKDLDNLILQVDAIDGMSSTYSNMEESEIADSLWKIHSQLAQVSENLNVIYFDHNNQGFSFQHGKQFDSAAVYFERGLKTANELEDSVLIVTSLFYLGENASWAGEFDKAISIFEILEALPEKYYNPASATRVYSAWADADAGKGNFREAYQRYKKYKEIDDEYWIESTNSKTLELEAKYQSAKKDAEINAQQLQISQSNALRNLLLVGALGLGLLTWFLFYRNRKNQILSSEIIQNLEKQQKLVALDYMVQGQEEERRRIAQDLHDGLGGLLASASIQMQKIQSQIEKLSDMDLFAKAEEIISTANKEVRRISHDMMPSALIDLGLVDAIEDLIEMTRRDHDLNIQFTSSDPDISLSHNHSVNLYRIIQEILSNTLKHSMASQFEISLMTTQDQIQLHTSDNGKGFDLQEAKDKDGIGLKSIESRVQYLRGQIDIESGQKQGTNFMIRIPR